MFGMTLRTYGRSKAFLHVHVLSHLAQTEAAVEWAIRELCRELPQMQQAYRGFLRQIREAHRISMVKPKTDPPSVARANGTAWAMTKHLANKWDSNKPSTS
jgi:hypothetical protein